MDEHKNQRDGFDIDENVRALYENFDKKGWCLNNFQAKAAISLFTRL